MIQPITIERWKQAQEAERKLHKLTLEEGIEHYRISYGHNFRYLGIDPEKVQWGILEIGAADFPALRYVKADRCIIIEPMPSQLLKDFCIEKNILLLNTPFDKTNINENGGIELFEVWMFNVLQHVQDPESFISNAKLCRCVRYFEPIDTGITDYHPHSFTKDDFDRWFPGVNKFYNETTNQNFHDGPCCYGVWENKEV